MKGPAGRMRIIGILTNMAHMNSCMVSLQSQSCFMFVNRHENLAANLEEVTPRRNRFSLTHYNENGDEGEWVESQV